MDRKNPSAKKTGTGLVTVLAIGMLVLAATPGSSAQRLVLAEYFTSLF
jgi:hypothetical protein